VGGVISIGLEYTMKGQIRLVRFNQFAEARQHERGAALIVVLGLVAVIAGWAATSAYEDLIAIRRADNGQAASKAELACLSALELARVALREDANNTQEDSLEEDWAMDAPVFPVDDGLVSAEVVDANRFLNINDLINARGEANPTVVVMFRTLFQQLNLDTSLVDALVDWLDKDAHPFGSGGAEDASYYDQPYKVKNAPLDRLEELLFIRGFTATDIRILTAFVVARKSVNGQTRVNVNTALPEVLQAMFPSMSQADVETLISGRPYVAVPTQTSIPGLSGAGYAQLSVQSDAFMVKSRAIFGNADWQEAYFLERNGTKVQLVWRERLIWQP